MQRFQRFVCILVLGALVWNSPLVAQEYAPTFPLKEPIDYGQIDFYLQTVDVGESVHMKFGHSALRLVDHRSGLDILFNWGLFNFDTAFPLKFYKGDLLYILGIYSYQTGMRSYERDERSVWQDKLNLTDKQKAALMAKLVWNARRENREYLYEFYFDNCSTRIRDYINEAIGDKIKERYANVGTGETYRYTVENAMDGAPLIQAGLETIMNERQEVEMTAWHKMFLPAALRVYFLEQPAYDDNGQPTGQMLLVPDKMLWDFPRPAPAWLLGHQWLCVIFCLPLALLWFIWGQRKFGKKSYRLLGVLGLGWSGVAGIFGFLMLIGWTWSSHLILKSHPNLWLYWITDFWFLYVFFSILKNGGLQKLPSKVRKFLKYYAIAHLVVAFSYMIAFFLGMFQTNVKLTVHYMVPPLFLMNALIVLLIKGYEADGASDRAW